MADAGVPVRRSGLLSAPPLRRFLRNRMAVLGLIIISFITSIRFHTA